MQNNVIKYITNIGQNTGMLNTSKKVQIIAMTVLLEIAYQNLNSGNLRMNGRNSSFDLVGNSGPCSSVKILSIITINCRIDKILSKQTTSICVNMYAFTC